MKRILPAYPLFVKDPYFSIWANAEELNKNDVIFWTGTQKKIYGYLIVDGKRFCFLGNDKSCEQAVQTGLSVTAFTTDYSFMAAEAKLNLSFVSPLPPNDLSLLSCPVCYVNYEVLGGKDTEVVFLVEQGICYNSTELLPVRGGTVKMDGFELSHFGLKRQLLLSDDSDRYGADWGYWYLSGEKTFYTTQADSIEYLVNGKDPSTYKSDGKMVLMSINSGKIGKVMLGFDDTVGVNYFGDLLKGYYLDGNTIFDALEYTHKHSSEIDEKLANFDRELCKKAEKYGEDYINILKASLRQSVAAHKLVKDREGGLLFISKECCSNGCMGTVDVSYPSIPLYLLFNPELVRGMLRPIFKFAKMPVWKYDFAPHDIGAYPNACGQVYGLVDTADKYRGDLLDTRECQTRFPLWQLPASADVYAFKYQMPVEESGNMLIMLTAAYKRDGDTALMSENFTLLEKWVEYLLRYGLKPESQLCTDDFSGHLKNNINLAIKATVGIACFAEICKALNFEEKYDKFRAISEDFAKEIEAFSEKHTHLPLAWDCGEETYSLKYNFAFDKILGLNLFSQSLFERETDFYITKMNEYGIPLDNRAEFTKSDWLMWTASLTEDMNKVNAMTSSLNGYLLNSEDRLPFGDWYETKSGRLIGFRNRTVQGGCFILLLK